MTSSTVTGGVDQIPCNSGTLVMSNATFLLRNVLEVPEVKLEDYLKRLTDPEVNCKMRLCGSCTDDVTTAKRIYQEMIDAQRRFKEAKFKISRKVILSEQGIVCGDKEPDFSMTFVKEIVNNHGRENLASVIDGDDPLNNNGTCDNTDDDEQEGTPGTEVGHVTTASRQVIEPELAGGIDIPNVKNLNAELPTTSASVVNQPWLNTEPKLEDLLLLDQYVEAIAEPEVSKTEGSTPESGTEEDDCMLEFEYHFKEQKYSPIVTLNSQDFVNAMETGNSSDENASDEERVINDLLKIPKAKAGTSKMELKPAPEIKVIPKPKRKKAPKFCLLATAKDPNAPHGLVIKGLRRIPKALEGPVKCKCGKQFTNTGHLRRHVKESLVSDKEHFRCEICFRGVPSKLVTFKREENLRWHVKMVHEKNRGPCPKCGKLMYPKNFNRHLKRCGMKIK